MTSRTTRPALRALALAAALAAAASGSAAAGDVTFTIERVFGPDNRVGNSPARMRPGGINTHGEIAGTVIYSNTSSSAFRTQGGVYEDVGSNFGSTRSSADGIADNGMLIGTFGSGTAGGIPITPFLYSATGSVAVINAPSGSFAAAIDPTGQWWVLGSPLGSYVGRVGQGVNAAPIEGSVIGINRQGDFVGNSNFDAFAVRAGNRLNLSNTNLLAINRWGDAVGTQRLGTDSNAIALRGNTVFNLGGTTERVSATAINDNGLVVGATSVGVIRAVVLEPRQGFRRIDELVVGLGGDQLVNARAVNEHGQIVGEAFSSAGQAFAYIVTPTGTLRWDGGSTGRFADAANWDSGAGLIPGKFLDVVFTPAGNATALADRSLTMKSLVVGNTTGGGTARLQLVGGARLESTVTPVIVEARGLLVGDGTIVGHLFNRGTVGETSGAPLALTIEGQLDNSGLVTGSGTVAASLVNRSGPGVRVQGGQSLSFVGALHTNADGGRIEVRQGGELAFSGPLVNHAGATVRIDNGTLRTGGLDNTGVVQVGFGGANVFGDVNNGPTTAGGNGRIVASGAANVSFWDRVNNQGEIRASAGSRLLYFGDVSGSGSFTTNGGGYHRFEGDFTAVASVTAPSAATASATTRADATATLGDVQFASTLTLHLAGTTAGTEHDQLVFNGAVLFDSGSQLRVLLDAGFAPLSGQHFQIFAYSLAPSGQFDALSLPTLDPLLVWDSSGLYTSGRLSVQAVPEPQSWALLLLGSVGMAARLRRRSCHSGDAHKDQNAAAGAVQLGRHHHSFHR